MLPNTPAGIGGARMPMAAAGSLGAALCRRRDPLVQAKQVLAELPAELPKTPGTSHLLRLWLQVLLRLLLRVLLRLLLPVLLRLWLRVLLRLWLRVLSLLLLKPSPQLLPCKQL